MVIGDGFFGGVESEIDHRSAEPPAVAAVARVAVLFCLVWFCVGRTSGFGRKIEGPETKDGRILTCGG